MFEKCNILFHYTKKSIFINVYTGNGKTILFLTSGKLQFNGKQKKTALSLNSLLLYLVRFLKRKRITIIHLHFRNTFYDTRRIKRYFIRKTNLIIGSVTDKTVLVHNGCRKSRRKRR